MLEKLEDFINKIYKKGQIYFKLPLFVVYLFKNGGIYDNNRKCFKIV